LADVFSTSGVDSDNAIAPTPQLQGLFISGIDNSQFIDGFGIVTPWGGGGTARRYGDYGISTEISSQNTQLNDLAGGFTSAEGGGLGYGVQGDRGPRGLRGIQGLPGIINIMGLNLPQNSNFLARLPHNLDLINSLGTAGNKLIYTSEYTTYNNFVWEKTSIDSDVKSWNDSGINTDASFFIIAADTGIYISTDDGDTWDKKNPDSDTYEQTNCESSGGDAVVLGTDGRDRGAILITSDYGVNWTEKTVTV